MWYLKFKYKHTDCLFTHKAHSLGISLFHYYLGSYISGEYVYSTGFQKLGGADKDVKKYISYLKGLKKIVELEVFENAVLLMSKHKKHHLSYKSLYNPMFIFPNPAIVDKNGDEIIEVAFWKKKPLQDLLTALKNDKTTTDLQILSFVERRMNDMYVSRLLPKLAPKQRSAISLAFSLGYYSFPRKISLDKLAKIAKVSKPTFRENLRRAEAKIIPSMVSQNPSM